MPWYRTEPPPAPFPSYLDGIIGDLRPETLRQLAKVFLRDYHRALREADWIEQRDKLRRSMRFPDPPLTPAQKRKRDRELRDLAIVRAAWGGKSDPELADVFGLSVSQIGRIIRASADKRARRPGDADDIPLCAECRRPADGDAGPPPQIAAE